MDNSCQLKLLERYYNISKVLLTVTPIVCVLYLNIGAVKIGSNVLEVIQTDPRLLIMFLSAMINPFVAYLLIFMQRKGVEGDIAYSIVNLSFIIVAEAMMQNLIFVFLIGFLLNRTLKVYKITLKQCFMDKIKNKFLLNISGAIGVLILSSICLFATIRINI